MYGENSLCTEFIHPQTMTAADTKSYTPGITECFLISNQGALMSSLENTAGMTSAALSLQPVSMLTSGLAAIGDAAAVTQSIPSMMGSNGTRSFNNVFGIMADFLDIVDEDIADRGRPLCSQRTISTLSGYILCDDADPSVSCSDVELNEIVSYMNNGFFYE